MKIKTGSGNTNIVFRFNPQEFSPNELKNQVLWRETDEENGNIGNKQANNNHNHNEIRLKWEGGYIVAPPSIHPNTNEYVLVNGINPIILKKEQIQQLINLLSEDSLNGDRKSKKRMLKNIFLIGHKIMAYHFLIF